MRRWEKQMIWQFSARNALLLLKFVTDFCKKNPAKSQLYNGKVHKIYASNVEIRYTKDIMLFLVLLLYDKT